MSDVLADSSALLAVVNEERGADIVRSLVGVMAISANNLAELVSKLDEAGVTEREILATVEDFDLDVLAVDAGLAIWAGRLRRVTKHLGLSLGDRVAIAEAMRSGLPIITADRKWTATGLPGRCGVDSLTARGQTASRP